MSVDEVLQKIDAVEHPVRRRDAHTLVELYQRITGEEPVLWYGGTIIGFGSYHWKYASGGEGDAGAAGFSPRKAATTVYLPDGFDDYADELAALGPHTIGKSCLYLKNLEKNDLAVLETLLTRSYQRCSAPGFGQVDADTQE